MTAKEKIVEFCKYPERCHQQVKNRLYDYGCTTDEVNELLAYCVEQNLLNEERYAKLYVQSKISSKWGRAKIIARLKANRASDYCIKSGLREIDENAYAEMLDKLALQKFNTTKGHVSSRKRKVFMNLSSKGFELNFIYRAIAKLK